MRETTPPWPPGPERPPLAAGDVHLWYGQLDAEGAVRRAGALLSADERERADGFGAEGLRQRFAAGRSLLRIVLARYVDAHPADLSFRYGEGGKPYLGDGGDAPAFNLSHSGSHLVVAVAGSGDIGVDVEEIRSVPRQEAIARRAFLPGERDALERLTGEARDVAFLACWTGKEAVAKAAGGGFRELLAGVEVRIPPPDGGSSPVLRFSPDGSTRCWVGGFQPAPGCIGTVAVRGTEPGAVRCWRLTGPAGPAA